MHSNFLKGQLSAPLASIGLICSLPAQQLEYEPRSSQGLNGTTPISQICNLKSNKKVEASLKEPPLMLAAKNLNLAEKLKFKPDFESLRVGHKIEAPLLSSNEKNLLALIALYRENGEEGSCPQISLSVEQKIKFDFTKVLEIVETEITANPNCSCEVVKAAINAIDANVEDTVTIVKTAINASPESSRIICQCAIAANPKSLQAIQELLSQIEGDLKENGDSAKSAKSAKAPVDINALTLPYLNPLDILFELNHHSLPPTIVSPDTMTNVNP